MPEKIDVKVSHQFKASTDQVYAAWLDPDKVRLWQSTALQSMGLTGDIGQVEIDAKVGGKFLFTDMRDGVEARHWGTYLELECPHKIVFNWITDVSEESDPSQVAVTIEPEGEGCIVTIVHQLDAKWAEYVKQTEGAWSCMMQAINGLLAG